MEYPEEDNAFFDRVLVIAFLLSLMLLASMLSRSFQSRVAAAPGAGVTPSTSFGRISLGIHGKV